MKTRKIALKNEFAQPTHEEIARLAYALWQQRGCPSSQDLEIWLQAERVLSASRKSRPRSRRSATVSDLDQFDSRIRELLAGFGSPPDRRSPTAL